MDNPDHYFMQICLQLAKQALTNGNPPVGSVLVYKDQVIGKGIEAGKSSGDIRRHAEVEAIQDAILNDNKEKLGQSVMYTTHEPCIMCSYVIRHYQIPKIVIGLAVDHIGGATGSLKVLETTSVPNWKVKPELVFDLEREACLELNNKFSIYMKEKNQ